MLRKIMKGICCIVLWISQVSNWINIFETWPLFNQVTNATLVIILSLVLAVFNFYGIISIVEFTWEQ